MAVVSVTPLLNWRGSVRDPFRHQYTRFFGVVTDDDDDGPQTVENDPGLPALYFPYVQGNDSDPNALVKSKEAFYRHPEKSLRDWVVKVEWDNNFTFNPATQDENPLLRPTEYELHSDSEERFATRDLEGQPFMNAANESFTTAPAIRENVPVIRAYKNVASQSFALLDQFVEHINDGVYQGLPRGSLLCSSITYSRPRWENQIVFFEQQIEFRFKATQEDVNVVTRGATPDLNTAALEDVEGWWHLELNAGLEGYVLGAGDVSREPILDAHNQPVRTPVPLNALGSPFATYPPAAGGGVDKINYFKYRLNKYADFAGLSL